MEPYRNRGGQSNVIAYKIEKESIQIVFREGDYRNYLFDEKRPGKEIVEELKKLAKRGEGLNAYLVTVVKKNYAKKW